MLLGDDRETAKSLCWCLLRLLWSVSSLLLRILTGSVSVVFRALGVILSMSSSGLYWFHTFHFFHFFHSGLITCYRSGCGEYQPRLPFAGRT